MGVDGEAKHRITKVPIADLRSDVRNFWRKNSSAEQKNETVSDSSDNGVVGIHLKSLSSPHNSMLLLIVGASLDTYFADY